MIPLPASFLDRPIAHRALHDRAQGRAENSFAAIDAAIGGDYGIELDLQLSRDGQAVVFHDYDLDRLTDETGLVAARDAAELGQITLCGGSDQIPTFAEVLDRVQGRVPLLIELKDQHGHMGVTDGTLERAVAQALKGYAGPAALMSFNPNMVVELSRLVPDLPRGIVSSAYDEPEWQTLPQDVLAGMREISDFERANCSFISHHAPDLSRARVQSLRASGVPILTWTIRSPEEQARSSCHSDNITFEGYNPA